MASPCRSARQRRVFRGATGQPACRSIGGRAMSVNAYTAQRSGRDADAMVMQHAELVKRIAYHLVGRLPPSVEVADLIQAGMLGLLEAAAHFTADRGASF